jgi:two-component system chemotaxis response regulator CheB
MFNVGAQTIGQDEQTCVVYGMPKEAVKLGAVQQEIPLPAIAGAIERYGK